MDFFTNRIRVGENVSIENLLVLLIVIKRAFREVKIEEKVCYPPGSLEEHTRDVKKLEDSQREIVGNRDRSKRD